MRKKLTRIGALLIVLVILCGLWMTGAASQPEVSITPLTILFTHDTHDHFYPDAADVGGYTRLSALLERERAAATGPVVTLDAGDFSMGSPFQTVYPTDAPELRALGAMGYDVTTFGNHEYDFRPQGLANMLASAKASGERLPALVQANYKTPKNETAQVAVDAMRDFPVTDYVVLEREGKGKVDGRPLTIAVFGVLGVDSDECTPLSGMQLEPLVDASKRVVAEIKEKVDPDYIIALSHSGTENGKGEDYELAKAVDGIDVIISGHTHTTLAEPIYVNGTYVVSCGPYTQNLGTMVISKTIGAGGEKVTAESYRLIPIDSSLPTDPAMVERCEGYKGLVDQNYLANYGLSYDEVLTTATQDFSIAETGDMIGESYIETVRMVEGDSYVPIAFAVAPDGVIRDVIRQGQVTTADAFNILSLGVGADGTAGYPLMSIYLTGKDLKNAFEVDASVSAIMPAATLFGAGSRWTYNDHRMFLDRVTSCYVDGKPVQDDQLYRVVADLYSGQMLATVKSKSFGLLSITPRDAQGNEITDYEACIIHASDGSEVKAWYALAAGLQRADQVSPLSEPSKTVSTSWNPLKLLIPMGWPTLVVFLLGLVILFLIIFIIYRIATRKKHKARKAAKKAAKKARKAEKAAARTGNGS